MKRLRSAIATSNVIDGISPDVRATRAQHAIARDWSQRRADALADLNATRDVLERTKRLLPEAEAAVEAAKAALAAIEAENLLMAG